MSSNTHYIQTPRYLWFVILSFSMILAIANWYDARLISLFGLNITPGTLFFPVTFLLSDVITEVYGYKNARLAIWTSLFFNTIFVLFGNLITILPGPSFANNNEAFDQIIQVDSWIIIASFISYLVSEPLNAFLVAKLKIQTKGHYIGLRFLFSTVVASSIDTPLFVMIAFHKTLNFNSMISLIIPIWSIKCLVEILLLPISIRFTKLLIKKENINIFDTKTNFNLFSLDVDYSEKT